MVMVLKCWCEQGRHQPWLPWLPPPYTDTQTPPTSSVGFCSLPNKMKVFTLHRFWFKDCGLNKNATADSWFSLTATSAPWLCSQFGLRPKWQLWSHRAITMFPQCSANNRRLTPQPHVNSGVQIKPESGWGIQTVVRKAAGKTTMDKEHTHSYFYQKQRRTCWLFVNPHGQMCLSVMETCVLSETFILSVSTSGL